MDSNIQEGLSYNHPTQNEELSSNGQYYQHNARKKCPAHFSYRLVIMSQKTAVFISIANIFYCVAFLALSTRIISEKNFCLFSSLYCFIPLDIIPISSPIIARFSTHVA